MSRSAGRPNFVWFSFEDTNPFYGCYGDLVARTPNLDRLAAEGAIWTNCFSTAGVCAPARSAIITGMYAISIGTHHMRTTHVDVSAPDLPTPYSAVVPHYVKCFTEYLRAGGYYCTNNEKTDYQFDPPVTAWDECSAEAHWRNRPDPDQPFFAVFNPTRTHESGMWEAASDQADGGGTDPAAVTVPPYFPDTPRVRAAIARMYDNIAASDAELGRVLAELEADGLAENTIVMHWSDHGPLPRGKRWPYDSGIHVPLIVRWPVGAGNPGSSGEPVRGFDPGTVLTNLVSTIDLGPTVLSLAGVAIPAHMQGKPFLGPEAGPPRRYVFASRDRHDTSYDMIRAARDDRFKYIRHYYAGEPYLLWIPYRNRHPIMQELYDGYLAGTLTEDQMSLFRPRPPEELYDRQTDPYELDNLATDPAYADELERLGAATEEWRVRVGDMGVISEREMVRRWYPDGTQPRTATPIAIPICQGRPGVEPITPPGHVLGLAERSKHRRGAAAGRPSPAAEKGTPGHRLPGPAMLQLHCSTQGASIAWRYVDDTPGRWRLYTSPISLAGGRTAITMKAIRIGYAESEAVSVAIDTTPGDMVE
jgi:N-sulfoglucosamine sulfohydrolase